MGDNSNLFASPNLVLLILIMWFCSDFRRTFDETVESVDKVNGTNINRTLVINFDDTTRLPITVNATNIYEG